VREFEYNGIKQQNRNGLLGRDSSIDGLKTGHTDSAGFCLVTSALRDGMRVVSVVLGSKSFKGREDASGALINYAFTFYDTKLVAKGGAKLASAPVWKAAATPVDVGVNEDLYITLPRSASGDIKTTVEVRPGSSHRCRTTTTSESFTWSRDRRLWRPCPFTRSRQSHKAVGGGG